MSSTNAAASDSLGATTSSADMMASLPPPLVRSAFEKSNDALRIFRSLRDASKCCHDEYMAAGDGRSRILEVNCLDVVDVCFKGVDQANLTKIERLKKKEEKAAKACEEAVKTLASHIHVEVKNTDDLDSVKLFLLQQPKTVCLIVVVPTGEMVATANTLLSGVGGGSFLKVLTLDLLKATTPMV